MNEETIVFVEFWPAPTRPLVPFSVMTVDAKGSYSEYDCAPMKNGNLIYDMSGAGLTGYDAYVTRGPWWATNDVSVRNHGERRVRRLPKRLRQWPPKDAVEAKIADCPTCGFVPDEGDWPEDGYRPCPHLKWDDRFSEWVPRRRRRHAEAERRGFTQRRRAG